MPLRRVKPDRHYGIRLPAAFAPEPNGYALNAFGALRLLRFAAAVPAMGLALRTYSQAPFWLPIAGLFATRLLHTVRSIRRHAETTH